MKYLDRFMYWLFRIKCHTCGDRATHISYLSKEFLCDYCDSLAALLWDKATHMEMRKGWEQE